MWRRISEDDSVDDGRAFYTQREMRDGFVPSKQLGLFVGGTFVSR
jgi:hypothetical protein